jgi:hypothetical protein
MKASKSMRIWFVLVGLILWAGIYLTGFSKVSWVLYIPAAGFALGAVTGICPSLTLISKMLGFTEKRTSD